MFGRQSFSGHCARRSRSFAQHSRRDFHRETIQTRRALRSHVSTDTARLFRKKRIRLFFIFRHRHGFRPISRVRRTEGVFSHFSCRRPRVCCAYDEPGSNAITAAEGGKTRPRRPRAGGGLSAVRHRRDRTRRAAQTRSRLMTSRTLIAVAPLSLSRSVFCPAPA